MPVGSEVCGWRQPRGRKKGCVGGEETAGVQESNFRVQTWVRPAGLRKAGSAHPSF